MYAAQKLKEEEEQREDALNAAKVSIISDLNFVSIFAIRPNENSSNANLPRHKPLFKLKSTPPMPKRQRMMAKVKPAKSHFKKSLSQKKPLLSKQPSKLILNALPLCKYAIIPVLLVNCETCI